MGQRAVYKDEHGQTYSAPLEWDASSSAWLMRTCEGLKRIEFIVSFEGRRLSFVEYRDEQPPPADQDTRLHVEPGQNSFAQLQDAGAQATLQYRTQWEQQRREMLEVLNQPDARKMQQARDANNLLATRYQKHREVQPISPTALKEVMDGPTAEQHRFRRKKKGSE